jgi:hypothetical protein
MSLQSLQSLQSPDVFSLLSREPRALLVKRDSGSVSYFISGRLQYFVGAIDAWSTEEPCSRQSLNHLNLGQVSVNIGQVFHRNF